MKETMMVQCTNHKICVADALKVADAICQKRQLRFTRLRRKVFEMIWAHHAPSKAYDILDKLKAKKGSAQPPTVYRALDFLLHHRLIHKLNSQNAYIGCVHPLQAHHCFFLICRQCKQIEECCDPALASTIGRTARQNQFSAQNITLEIEGECQACRAQVAPISQKGLINEQ